MSARPHAFGPMRCFANELRRPRPVPQPLGDAAAARDRAARSFAVLGFGAVIFGFLCRLIASDSPLWNDEVWSLRNLRPLDHFWQVLWGLSHDNNHVLTSLWLYFAGRLGDNPVWLRLPSLLAGSALIPLMARIGAARSAATALAAAVLTAASFFQITFGAEARGYAGASLALMAAYAALECGLDRPEGRSKWALAAASGLGLFCHLAIGPAVALLGFVALAENFRRRRAVVAAFVQTWRLFWPAGLAMLPATLCFAAGYVLQGGFTIGFVRPYGAGHAIGAMANMAMTSLGLDPTVHVFAFFGLVGLPIAIVAAIALIAPPHRRIAYSTFLLVIPALVLLLHPPNSHIPRYYFVASPFLLLLAAEICGAAWSAGRGFRVLALIAVGFVIIGDARAFVLYQEGKWPGWPGALDEIAAAGGTRLSSSFDFNVGKLVDHYNLRSARPLRLTPPERLCEERAEWRVVEMGGNADPEERIEVEGAGCTLAYQLTHVYGRRLPEQSPWALYRLTGAHSERE